MLFQTRHFQVWFHHFLFTLLVITERCRIKRSGQKDEIISLSVCFSMETLQQKKHKDLTAPSTLN